MRTAFCALPRALYLVAVVEAATLNSLRVLIANGEDELYQLKSDIIALPDSHY